MIRTEPSDHVHMSSRTPIGQTPLTKREYFAGLAMQGELSGQSPDTTWMDVESLVKRSVLLADALINELNHSK